MADMTGMTRERWNFLFDNTSENLTEDEVKDGWHFCPDFDYLLMRNNDESIGFIKTCVCGN